ncbi:hypothetical protein NDU88_011765 [Pleurodeles waltl]|uniref:Uncharacterized protein n=1 Tax=Pleurodeles waltl TaxID=8319 RepID=A0AAV7R023_PLEWA|nr:hypothetical protein NDU88_011765 [Pleurodeles waltl]
MKNESMINCEGEVGVRVEYCWLARCAVCQGPGNIAGRADVRVPRGTPENLLDVCLTERAYVIRNPREERKAERSAESVITEMEKREQEDGRGPKAEDRRKENVVRRQAEVGKLNQRARIRPLGMGRVKKPAMSH